MKIQFSEIKGAKVAVFWDANHSECSWQPDIIQNHKLLWLGVNIAVDGKPGFRMLLDKSRALVLREIITQFIETETCATMPDEMPEKTKPQKPIETSPTEVSQGLPIEKPPETVVKELDEIQSDNNQNPQA